MLEIPALSWIVLNKTGMSYANFSIYDIGKEKIHEIYSHEVISRSKCLNELRPQIPFLLRPLNFFIF